MVHTIALINDTIDIKEIIPRLKKENGVKIISFDIGSHYLLEDSKIQHEFMETYVSSDDKKQVTYKALDIALNWHKAPEITKHLMYNDINLGWLLELEFQQFLTKILKEFVGLIRILEKEKPKKILASKTFSQMLVPIIKNDEIELIQISDKTNIGLVFDKISIPIKVGKKQLNFTVSRKFALKIKKLTETVMNKLFNLQYISTKFKSNKILLVDFDPSMYSDLLENLSSLHNEIILLNSRKPAAWNLSSLNVIRKTKSKVLTFNNEDASLRNKIDLAKKDMHAQLDLVFLENLDHVFSIMGFSFWSTIKNNLHSICLQRFTEAVVRIEKISDFFSNNDITCIVAMYNAGAEERVILSIAQKFGIKGFLLQHGFYPQNNYIRSLLPITGYEHILSLTDVIWGNSTRNFFHQLGVHENEMILTGSPRHDVYFNTKLNGSPDSTILLATNVIMGFDFHGFDTLVHLNHHNFIREVCQICSEIKDKKIAVKLHPGQSVSELKNMIKKINPQIPIYSTQSIFDLIKSCDILISTSWSTVIFEAMILGKPTITFLADPKGFEEEDIIKQGITIHVKNSKELQEALFKILNDQKFRDELVNKGKKYIEQFLVNRGTASANLAKVLTSWNA